MAMNPPLLYNLLRTVRYSPTICSTVMTVEVDKNPRDAL